MSAKPRPPTEAELRAVLGGADELWFDIMRALEAMFGPLDEEWKPSKAAFGRICLLRHKKRTLLYITPDNEKVWIAIVLAR